MSSCFYDNGGFMVGLDKHMYLMAGPGWLAFTGIPISVWHLVGAPHWWPPASASKRCDTVTSEGDKMLKEGFTLYLVPHIPLTTEKPAVLELPNLGEIFLTSKSKNYLSAHSVTSGGKPLAVCVKSMLGLNLNCGKPIGLGLVINTNSVTTTPTLGDYVGAAAAIVMVKLVDKLIDKPLKRSVPNPILRFLLKEFFISPYLISPITTPIRRFIQETIDGT